MIHSYQKLIAMTGTRKMASDMEKVDFSKVLKSS